MNTITQIERIKIKLRLAKNTDTFFEVFGADSHRYKLANPVKSEIINRFEEKHNIELPVGYKTFLTEIGTGFGFDSKHKITIHGAGPEIGLITLSVSEKYNNYLDNELFFDSSMKDSDWERETEILYEGLNEDDEEAWNKAYSGILVIGDLGCIGIIGLILNGKHRGQIVYGALESEYRPILKEEANFLDWYEAWLDKIISGENIKSKGHNTFSEKELIDRYTKSEERHWKTVSLAYIRFQNSISNELLQLLSNDYQSEKDSLIKLYILNILSKFDYDNIKDELKELSKENPIEFLKILHLYRPSKTEEWLGEILNIYEDINTTLETKEYIKYVTEKDNKNIKYIF